jgi:hypothetical protein
MDESSAVPAATLEFLNWVAARERTHAEAFEAWQTSCPRSSAWEDSFIDGFVCLERRSASDESVVTLTPRGRSIIERAAV